SKKKNVHIELKLNESSVSYENELFYYNDLTSLKKLKEKSEEESLEITKFSSNHIEGILPTIEKDKVLVFTIPYDSAWKIRIDNHSAELIKVADNLLGIKVKKGNKKLVMKYEPKGFLLGSIISLVSLVIFV